MTKQNLILAAVGVFIVAFVILQTSGIGLDLAAMKVQPKVESDGRVSATDMSSLNTLGLFINAVISAALAVLGWTTRLLHSFVGKITNTTESIETDTAAETVLIQAIKAKNAVTVKALCNMIAGEEFLK